jgi:hypothetical protein
MLKTLLMYWTNSIREHFFYHVKLFYKNNNINTKKYTSRKKYNPVCDNMNCISPPSVVKNNVSFFIKFYKERINL